MNTPVTDIISDLYDSGKYRHWQSIWEKASSDDVMAVLQNNNRSFQDFLVLLSPVAREHLEKIAHAAHTLTLQRFGKIIHMYVPLYISNECNSDCVYCGFGRSRSIQRITLTADEIVREAHYLTQQGFHAILLLSGEAPSVCSPDYFALLADTLHTMVSSLSVEVYPMSYDEYRLLVEHGIEGLTVYQETYNKEIYHAVHPIGKKRDYQWRLGAPERAAQAGMRKISIGALLGLHAWRTEAAFTAMHAYYLWKSYWRTHFSISLPRLVEADAGYIPESPVDNTSLIQLMCAFRLFLPDIGINISTRESSDMRNHVIPLGTTQMSAGSSTQPGGYTVNPQKDGQFTIHDARSPHAVAEQIRRLGYEPVWKDWDTILSGPIQVR